MGQDVQNGFEEQIAVATPKMIDFYEKFITTKQDMAKSVVISVVLFVILSVLSLLSVVLMPYFIGLFFIGLIILATGIATGVEFAKEARTFRHCIEFFKQVGIITEQEMYEILYQHKYVEANVLRERYKKVFNR